jgi:uncharacterized protein involved in exopolysaccharide biosynthesis
MDKDDREMLIRVDENVKELKEKIGPLVERVEDHHTALEIIKQDRKWLLGIALFLGGLGSVVFDGIWGWFKK